jgi:hypothetical protein
MLTPEETQTVEQPSLSLQDLITVINIIQLMNKRGAIQASEMSMVGGVYEIFRSKWRLRKETNCTNYGEQ